MGHPAHTDAAHRHPLPVWGKILIIIAVFLLVLILSIAITIHALLSKIDRPSVDQQYATESELEEIDLRDAVRENQNAKTVYPTLDPEDIHWSPAAETIDTPQELFNVLLIGEDARPGDTASRSDAIILMSFDKSRSAITMTSFLRDLYVQIPGHQDNRINAAYAFGGMKLLDQTIEQNFGVHIDANVAINFDGFTDVIDALGGVDIPLSDAETSYLRLAPGENHLDGATALAYSRIRVLDSDFGRAGRQRKVIDALFSSLKHSSLTELTDLINTVLPLLTTDMSNSEILTRSAGLFPMLSGSTLGSLTIPAEGTYSFHTVREMSVIVADFDANRTLLKDTLEPGS